MTEHHVYFAVFGFDEPPQAISLLAGIPPDDSWCAGDAYSSLLPEVRRLDSRWILSSNLDQHASHRDHFERLILKLERLGDRLPVLRERYRCGIGVSQYFFMDDPAFYLPADLLARVQALGLSLSFDQLALDS
ncbi:hypothetical protein A167_03518 [Alcanivorax sp. S71-1-4]|uniref:DUF4279 domain-containing protein n=1 Tax=Alcanivorax sp. S71-1-4 TaxID=1177159 RepID=UPI00135842FE|nr:DUF4279 domain-containing protein [Alcanivorax sp. S71-1-4]KAF0805285.1 hypothetical protein A167_03518 [Alcanivorax sp. S71-1-4]